MEQISAIGIQSAYGKKKVLLDVNLSAESGQCVGIVGANGCGKSTLFQILSGLRKADRGSIFFDGKEAGGRAGKKLFLEYVGYVPQENNLITELSVRDNLLLWYQNRKELEQELREGFLHMLGLDEMGNLRTGNLSGGMKKRVSIGCALAGKPPILLLDEPNAALDLPGKAQIRQHLLLYKKMGGTVLIATHDESDLDICEKVYAMKQGVSREIDRTLRGDALLLQLGKEE